MNVLTGSPFDGFLFDTFRLQDTYFAPNALTLVTVGLVPKKLLKKVRAITFFTGRYAGKLPDANVTWRGAGLLPAFNAPHRLVFDFLHDKGLSVQAAVQVLAAQHGEKHL